MKHILLIGSLWAILGTALAFGSQSDGYSTPVYFGEGNGVTLKSGARKNQTHVIFDGMPAGIMLNGLTQAPKVPNGKDGRAIKCRKATQVSSGPLCSVTFDSHGAYVDAPMDSDFNPEVSDGYVRVVRVLESPYGGLNVTITGPAAQALFNAMDVEPRPYFPGLKQGKDLTCIKSANEHYKCDFTLSQTGKSPASN